ncbi:MAG: hypothetical protein ACXV74_00385 [Methylobacter sp.]
MKLSIRNRLIHLEEKKKHADDRPLSLSFFYGNRNAEPGQFYKSLSDFYGDVKNVVN